MAGSRRVAVITGAAGGLGMAVARRLQQDGFTVECADVATGKLPRARWFRVDVTDADAVEALARDVMKRRGRVDALVNAAGILGVMGPVHLATREQVTRVMDVNVLGALRCFQAFLPALRETRGAVVNVASVNGLRAAAQAAVYSASKFALVGLTRNAALDHARQGLRINAVCPGPVDTAMLHASSGGAAGMASLAALVPAGRNGTPADVAGAVSWLCSADAAYVNGACVVVDGGMSA